VERDADGRLLLVVDRMDILRRLPQFRFHVVNHVRAEIRYENQRVRLQAATAGGGVTEIEITDRDEILLYDELRKFLGDGESASLAVAVSRRWIIAADEKGRFRREVFNRLGEDYLLDTLGALLTAIRSGVITVAHAEALRRTLQAHRCQMDSTPFDELLRES